MTELGKLVEKLEKTVFWNQAEVLAEAKRLLAEEKANKAIRKRCPRHEAKHK